MNVEASQRHRLLIAEDEALIAEELRDRVLALDCDVVEIASSADDAVTSARRDVPDLILMDIRLRGRIDGIQAAQQIREELGIGVLFLTAHSDEATVRRAAGTAPLGYLIKPIDERELVIAIRMALERVHLERRLRESEQLYATTLKSIADAVVAADASGRVTYMNPAAERLMGWPMAQARGRLLGEVVRLIEAEPNDPVQPPARSRLLTRDGLTVSVDDLSAPVVDERGRTTGLVVVCRDRTEQLRAQETLRRAEQQMRQSQKMEAIGRLAGGVSHDINNMMTVISGFSELILAGLTPEHPMRELVTEIRSAGDRVADITRQLLAFSRRQPMPAVPLDLNEILTGMQTMLLRLIGPEVTLKLELAPRLKPILADRSQMEQVILNLTLNARDAMSPGGTLRLSTANVSGDSDSVLFAVTDDGHGMTPDVLARVFEPFFTTKELGRGTGLGLPTVYGIIQQIGGRIDVASEVSVGTTFTIELPVAAIGEPAPMKKHELPELVGGTQTILLVDDEDAVRRITRRSLQELGYAVIEAASSDEAIAILSRSIPVDLLLAEATLPRMNGYELAARARVLRPGLKVLFVSGSSDESRSRSLDDALADAPVVAKPFTAVDLSYQIRELFS